MEETEYVLGIDPGKSGALCFLPIKSGSLIQMVTPEIKGTSEIDMAKLYAFVYPLMPQTRLCVIEDVHSIFGSSAKSNFQFGRALGVIEMLPVVFSTPVVKVAPKKWQSVAWEGVPLVKKPGTRKVKGKVEKCMKTDAKATSLNASKRLFPRESFLATKRSSIPHDGLVDAALLAYYGKREHLGDAS